ncbi:hypothetical protein [Streptomyces sp. BE133]|uniref:hypothetical protein n=1 Tax=Streptomyces sp. BE133 TaxID=3002523 RepID=UPI002E79E7A0|nr:hypothetical protein [Streptomyces sp. BE133]MEE1809045.1 hypothetical protein [Streptomyces sp. BE133]
MPTEPAFAELGAGDKIRMLPGPAWFGDFMFKPSFKVPDGRIAAAEMPVWPGESKSAACQVGGGAAHPPPILGGRCPGRGWSAD